MPSNLVDAFEPPDHGKREFCLPLASETAVLSDGTLNNWDGINNLAPASLFDIEDDRLPDMPTLTIRISPPASGFTQDGSLPHPAIRLHAIGRGKLTFKRGANNAAHSLTLEMTMLLGKILKEKLGKLAGVNLVETPWFDRWIEADCIPKFVFYENVDLNHLQFLIGTLIEPPPPGEESLAEKHGLALPQQLTQAQRDTFSDDFFNGTQSVAAYAGACIGQVAPDPTDINRRLLRLRCQYADGNPMNTRELFYLLFGNDSEEAVNHPLMKNMDDLGKAEIIRPISKRMLLRPPLRTHARVIWEAEREIDPASTKTNWGTSHKLDEDDLCNEDSNFRREGYKDAHKCNMFVEDICIRSGFRVPVWDVNGNNQYVNATYLAQRGLKVGTPKNPFTLKTGQKPWGRKWDLNIISANATFKECVDFINKMMDAEGRCFILAKQRNGRLPGGYDGLVGSAGHVAVIKQVLGKALEHNGVVFRSLQWEEKMMTNNKKELLLQSVKVKSYEAWGGGAVENETWFFALWPNGPRVIDGEDVDDESANNQLALIELCPGKDPFTTVGWNDLNAVIRWKDV